ncbi:lipopolysaccharide biosynthesis protein [Bacillus pacificus]|uniref:lipopolysaccharide biosynthesis protein n=1 Tax=Bacillus pacificus TaxID=2026187 RepID=UPI003D22420A
MSNNKVIMNKARKAVKWSTITELGTKLVSPITQMVLARLLAPEMFGIVVTVNMIISFTEIFIDAGFQKYIVQREFEDNEERDKNASVAFWTNLAISFLLWGSIVIFRDEIAWMVGNPGYGVVIAIACIQLPMLAFSSIQMAIFKRDFDFKTLFYARISVTLTPLLVTLPLAFLGFGYWALIIGGICGIFSSTVILTYKSEWRPSFFYSFNMLREMFSFSIWSLLEAIAIWFTSWIDAFIVGSILSSYYLGIYKNSLNMVNLIIAIFTSIITPVLFSMLSRLQRDEEVFKNTFLQAQKIIAFLLLPIGVGIFLYRDLVTSIILGSQWSEASDIIGIWALAKVIRIIFVSIYSEVYRAKGMPKLSLFLQCIDLILLVPACLFSVKYGFWTLVYTRAIMMADLIIPGLIVMNNTIGIKASNIIRNVIKPIICTLIMFGIAVFLKGISANIIWYIVSIIISIFIYGLSVFIIARKDLVVLSRFIKGK